MVGREMLHNIRLANGGYHCFLAIRSGAQGKGRLFPSFPSHQLLASSLNILRIHSITTRAAGSRFRWFCMRSHTARRCGRSVTLRPRSALSGPQACSGNIPMAACDWISPRITRRLSVMHRVRALRPCAFRNLELRCLVKVIRVSADDRIAVGIHRFLRLEQI